MTPKKQEKQTKQKTTKTQNNEQIELDLKKANEQIEKLTKISQHALADLQNSKRRAEEEKQTFVKFANEQIIKELLPSIENIQRSLNHEPKDEKWIEGATQSITQLTTTLERLGLKEIPTTNEQFNPHLHEALLTAKGEKDKILQELEKGYTYNEKVIKPARVTVGNGE